MFMPSLPLRRALLALALCGSAALAQADETFHVVVDTSSFAASNASGWLDLQFGGFGPASTAYASVSNLTGAFDLSQPVQLSGDATGSLASGFQLDSATSFNDVFQAVNYGGKFSFDVTLSSTIDTSASAANSLFTVSAFNAEQSAFLGQVDPVSGSLVTLATNPANGSVSVTVFDSAAASAVSAVPEPSSWLMLALGAGMVAFYARRRTAVAPALRLAA